MTCEELNRLVSAYLDSELSPPQAGRVELHLRGCENCNRRYEELQMVRLAVARRFQVPPPLSRMMWEKLQRRRVQTWRERFRLGWEQVRTWWRDAEVLPLWTRVAALPISLGFFFLLASQFQVDQLDYVLMAGRQNAVSSVHREVRLAEVTVRQSPAQLRDLLDTVWRIPYEDSLSLIAEVSPEGKAEIGSVLEYPKNQQLLDAIDSNLKGSRFEVAGGGSGYVIYSFQKIDVYDQLGL